jgi:hypothetical protein
MPSEGHAQIFGWHMKFAGCKPLLPTSTVCGMNTTLFRALVGLVPACMLFFGSVFWFFRDKTRWALLQLIGAGCLLVVLLAHLAEALELFPWMGWGLEHSAGHYLDLWSAVFGLTLFPTGYLFHALTRRVTQPTQ